MHVASFYLLQNGTALGLELFLKGGGYIHGSGAHTEVELLEAAQLSEGFGE